MAMGVQELVLLLFIIAPLIVVPIWALVDVLQQPDHAWEATGRNKMAWVLGLVLTWLLGFGIVAVVVAIVYLAGPRHDLRRAAAERQT